MKKVEIRNYPKFQLIKSSNESLIIIKIDNINGNFSDASKFVKDELQNDYFNNAGVYFLKLDNGYYIGETGNLKRRLNEHSESKMFSSVTFATYKSMIDELNKEEVKDLESILMEFVVDAGLTLGNDRNERRKTNNLFDHKDHQMKAQWIWENFVYLNINDILDEVKSKSVEIEEKINDFDKVNGNSLTVSLDGIIVKSNIKERNVNNEHDIFKYIEFTPVPTSGYNKKNLEIFNKKYSKTALYNYLYDGLGNGTVDKALTNGKRVKGYITAVTLAYLRVQTNGKSRGALNQVLSSEEAKNIINNFIDNNY